MSELSEVSRRMRDGLRGARAALVKGEQPRAFVKRFGALSAAEKQRVCDEVPGFAREYAAVCGGVVALKERRACEAEVRGVR